MEDFGDEVDNNGGRIGEHLRAPFDLQKRTAA